MDILDIARKVLRIESMAIASAVNRLGVEFEKAVDILFQCQGRVVVTGMGKSGLIGKKISATLTSTGTPSVFLHPSEALHGDIGIINPEDVVLALSTSGETNEVVRLLVYIKRMGINLISLVGNHDSTLARQSDVFVDCSIEREACPIGLVPTTSTTLTLALGDALSISVMERKGFSEEDFHGFHPAGSIGKKLLKVKHLMHTGEKLPLVKPDQLLNDVIKIIDEKRFGVGIVVDGEQKVLGIITDGDLRRYILSGIDFSTTEAQNCMTRDPLYLGGEKLAVEALKIMEDKLVTSLVVEDSQGRLIGLLHLHDLWRTEMI